jgi:hypothetical protein
MRHAPAVGIMIFWQNTMLECPSTETTVTTRRAVPAPFCAGRILRG